MKKYIKPETKIVEVKIESLLEGASGNLSFDPSGDKGFGNPWEMGAGKNHQSGYPWDELWEDPEEEEQ